MSSLIALKARGSGGTVSNASINGVKYIVHTYLTATSPKTFTVTKKGYTDLFVLGAGGSGYAAGSAVFGGPDRGPGGGAGGLLLKYKDFRSSSTNTVTVGIGVKDASGGNSSIFGNIAIGGGAGGYIGSGGGSGGGSHSNTGAAVVTAGGSGTIGQGNNGGTGIWNGASTPAYSGAGGGAGGAGGDGGNYTINAAGGVGLKINFDGNDIYYAGGGGAGGEGIGGLGGGTAATSSTAVTAGTDGLGGGSGGTGTGTTAKGGDGRVMVRYLL